MTNKLSQNALDQIFFEARSHNTWQDKPVSKEQIIEIVDLMKWGPTSANCSPARFIFVMSDEAKEKLIPLVLDTNQEKVRQAPACAIIGHDMQFHEHLPKLFPHTDAKSWFDGNDALIEETAFRNSTLQGAYFMIAARALGLDTGPMSGFDKDAVDKTFFADTNIKSNFLCTLGHGDPAGIFARSPRFSFDEMASII